LLRHPGNSGTGIAGTSTLCRHIEVPIRLPRRLRGWLDRNRYGYPQLSPLMGASVPRFRNISHRHVAPKLGGDFPPVAARFAFPRRIGKLPLSCGISLTWKHVAVRRCTGFTLVVERGARRTHWMVNACCGLRRWDYASSDLMNALLLTRRVCDGMQPRCCNVLPLTQWRSDHCFDVRQCDAEDACTVGGGDHE
jgi:hypothetical protein